MKFFNMLMVAGAFAFAACSDDSSSTAPEEEKTSYDCTVTDGVKVLFPAGGETFKMGDTITVIYGSDVEDSGYRFIFKVDADDAGMDMLEESAGPEKGDGKTCYEQKVVFTEDVAEASDEAIIRVAPYNKSRFAGSSKSFKVVE